jgi:Skp family chaperone for outer membrane proteins
MKQIIHIFIFLSFGVTSFGQSKDGYINYDKVAKTLPEYLIGQNQLDLKSKQLQDSFDILHKNYEDFLNNKIPHNIKVDSITVSNFEKARMLLEMKIQNFQNEAEIIIRNEENKFKLTLKNRITNEIKEFCISNNLNFLVDENAVYYCSNCIDYTDKLILFIKRKK